MLKVVDAHRNGLLVADTAKVSRDLQAVCVCSGDCSLKGFGLDEHIRSERGDASFAPVVDCLLRITGADDHLVWKKGRTRAI